MLDELVRRLPILHLFLVFGAASIDLSANFYIVVSPYLSFALLRSGILTSGLLVPFLTEWLTRGTGGYRL